MSDGVAENQNLKDNWDDAEGYYRESDNKWVWFVGGVLSYVCSLSPHKCIYLVVLYAIPYLSRETEGLLR